MQSRESTVRTARQSLKNSSSYDRKRVVLNFRLGLHGIGLALLLRIRPSSAFSGSSRAMSPNNDVQPGLAQVSASRVSSELLTNTNSVPQRP